MMFSSNRLDFTFNKTLQCFGLDVNTLHRRAAVTAEKTPRKNIKKTISLSQIIGRILEKKVADG